MKEKNADFLNQNFQGQECPPCPSKKEDLGLSAQVRMRDVDPILYQNLLGARQAEKLPADVLERMNAGHFIPSDQEAYLEADLDVYAGYCQKEAKAL